MPSRWALDMRESKSEALTPDRLHAVVSGLFSHDVEHHASRKAFTIRNVQLLAECTRLEIGIIDDGAVEGFLDSVTAHGDRWRFGGEYFSLSGPPVLLDYQSWETIAENAEPVSEIEFDFLTPTFFRRGDRYQVLPAPSVVFGHLRRIWADVFGMAPHCELNDWMIDVVSLNLRSRDISLRKRTRRGVIGTVRYNLSELDEAQQAALDAFARIAPFAGCGASTTFGCGATNYETHSMSRFSNAEKRAI